MKRRVFRLPWRSRRRIQEEVDEEIGFHLEMRAEEHMRNGLNREEARERARREFGDVEQARRALSDTDQARERRRRWAEWLRELRQDLGYGLRTQRRSPGFALVVVLTLALGIGANTALFSVADGVLFRPLPFRDADRLVTVRAGMSVLGEFVTLRDEARALEQVEVYNPYVELSLTGEGEPSRLSGAAVSPGLFSLLGVRPALGRWFLPQEGRVGEDDAVILSHGLWRERFGGDPGVVGRRLRLDGQSRTVVGVMPRGFGFPAPGTQVWIPAVLEPLPPAVLWGTGGYARVARLRPGATLERAQAEVSALAPVVRERVPWNMPAEYWGEAAVIPLREQLVGDVRPMLLVLLGAVGLVLLIACVNVANLLLARAAARRKEIAIRIALGAGRTRVVRQLLTESVLLALMGGAAGVGVALLGIPALTAILPPELPRLGGLGVDGRVLAFSLAITLLTGLLFGLVPALRASRPETRETLAEGRGSGQGRERQRLSAALVVAEVALAVVLLIGAGLLIQSLWRLLRVDPGFRAENVVTAWVAPPEFRYGDAESRRRLYTELLERLEALPDTRAVAVASGIPFGGGAYSSVFKIEGRPDPATEGGDWPIADARLTVSPDYFRAMGVPLLAGRTFTEVDRAGTPRVAVVSRGLAERYWPGEHPVGKRLRLLDDPDWRTVVGVVGDVRWGDLAGGVGSGLYVPLQQGPVGPMRLIVRTAAEAGAAARILRRVVAAVDADTPVSDLRTAEELISASVAGRRSAVVLLAAFALLALILGAIGIYGVVTYGVRQRTRELGVRIALGARSGAILRLVLGQGARLAAAGVALGLLGALALTRALDSLLFGVRATDPVTFAAVPLLLVLVALLASYLPARRATRVDPARVLGAE